MHSSREIRMKLRFFAAIVATMGLGGCMMQSQNAPAEQGPSGFGFALTLITVAMAWTWWRRRRLPKSRWFLRGVALSGVASVVAMEAGWITTEVGRQPWIVYNHLKTADAVSSAPGLHLGLWAVLAVYAVLTFLTIYTLRRLARHGTAAVAPQEVTAEPVGAAEQRST